MSVIHINGVLKCLMIVLESDFRLLGYNWAGSMFTCHKYLHRVAFLRKTYDTCKLFESTEGNAQTKSDEVGISRHDKDVTVIIDRHEMYKLYNFPNKKPFTDDGRIKFQADK